MPAEAAWKEYDARIEAKWAHLRAGALSGLTVVQREALAGDVYRHWLTCCPAGSSSAVENIVRDSALLQEWAEEVPSTHEEMADLMGRLGLDAVLAARGLVIHPWGCWPLVMAAQRAAQHACRYAM